MSSYTSKNANATAHNQALQYLMPFGKYRGQSLKLIALNDPEYLRWLATGLTNERIARLAQQVANCLGIEVF